MNQCCPQQHQINPQLATSWDLTYSTVNPTSQLEFDRAIRNNERLKTKAFWKNNTEGICSAARRVGRLATNNCIMDVFWEISKHNH